MPALPDAVPLPAPPPVPLEQVLADRRLEHLEEAPADGVVSSLAAMVAHPEYPCLGARSVFRRSAVTSVVLDDLTDTTPGGSLDVLGDRLRAFAASADPTGDLVSFVACFRGPAPAGERAFETHLWAALRHLHEHDDSPWPGSVADDPVDPHFAFSVGGTPFFVVGLHPDASRIARRAPVPTLVFNLHEQFERMRADGRYARMRDTIRRRDTDLQGSINPMVADHGLSSEALQYSGRQVPAGWTPPFHPRTLDEEPA
ncbi:guanitoxin biosynthesis heme-dependent pre-guanitoxin N-hydroxylase GntA [Phycicoccus avicenniae]|uniref:guanitoxin biosynthesis heme-dependent pre-guanitoxin N-hydroxylase GntA n=1 Tax=Phycicoccus avicenniae TaxID=2828860 RepID=UPI003D278C74